jgi:CRP-like cAMP-binding protein
VVVRSVPEIAMAGTAELHPLVRKLGTIFELSDAERHAILSLAHHVRDLKAGQDIVREFDRPSQCCVILEGFAVRYKSLDEGKRQIVAFHISGDMPDLQTLQLAVMDHAWRLWSPARSRSFRTMPCVR